LQRTASKARTKIACDLVDFLALVDASFDKLRLRDGVADWLALCSSWKSRCQGELLRVRGPVERSAVRRRNRGHRRGFGLLHYGTGVPDESGPTIHRVGRTGLHGIRTSGQLWRGGGG